MSAPALATAITSDAPGFAGVLDGLAHPVLVVGAESEVTYANAAALAAFGDDALGLPLQRVFPHYLHSPTNLAGDAALTLATGEDVAYDALFKPLGDGSATVSLWPRATIIEAADAAATDELTGLFKRTALMEHLSAAARDQAAGALAVHCLDLDRFKLINDTLGHAIGDALLEKVADRLRSACGPDAVIARVGGDEFVVLQPGLDHPDDAERLAARLVDLIGRTYVLRGHTVNIGLSLGLAFNTESLQARDLLRNADLALYEAKRAGRSRYTVFAPEMDADMRRRRALEIELRRAIALKQFALHYQPFIDLETDKAIGFEALLRWNHPQRGAVPPLEFIPLAEETGLIVKIGTWVLQTACKAAASWPEPMVVAVNVSPLQFKSDNLLAVVSDALERTGLSPERLEIEITEGALLDDTENVLETLHALRALGVKISMDDFGTGYSSLSYLQKFPFNKIKLDRSFVAGTGADSEAILKAVASLGTSLGMAITAEGVETAEQLARIRRERCTHVQGFLTGRPAAADAIARYFDINDPRER